MPGAPWGGNVTLMMAPYSTVQYCDNVTGQSYSKYKKDTDGFRLKEKKEIKKERKKEKREGGRRAVASQNRDISPHFPQHHYTWQAGRQAGRQTGRQTGRQAGIEVDKLGY